MKNYFPFILFTSLLASCSVLKVSPRTSIQDSDGLQRVENKTTHFSIVFYSDYRFHNISRDQTLNWDETFIKSLCRAKGERTILFCGHTVMEPYCSTVGVSYSMDNPDQMMSSIQKTFLSPQATDVEDRTQLIGNKNFHVISHNLKNAQLKITYQFLEFFTA